MTVEGALRVDWECRPGPERRRERAREGMRSKALRGMVLGRPPYGYRAEGRVLIAHPREAQVVRRIFTDYLDHDEGLRRIAAALNREGIRTRLGRTWTPGSVRVVLRNPTYTGLYRRLGIAVPRAHEALVDRATFQAVQRRMSAKRTSRTNQRRHQYLLAGLLRCGRCGSPMIGSRRGSVPNEVISYRCEAATSQGRCRAPSYRETAIEEAVRDRFVGGSDTPSPIGQSSIEPHTPSGSVARRRKRLERQLVAQVERWAGGEWTFRELVRRAARTARALHAQTEADDSDLHEPPALDLWEGWDNLDLEEKRSLLQAHILEIVVGRDGIRVLRR